MDEEATKAPSLTNGKDVNTKKQNSYRKLKGSKRKRKKEKRKRFRKKKKSKWCVMGHKPLNKEENSARQSLISQVLSNTHTHTHTHTHK